MQPPIGITACYQPDLGWRKVALHPALEKWWTTRLQELLQERCGSAVTVALACDMGIDLGALREALQAKHTKSRLIVARKFARFLGVPLRELFDVDEETERAYRQALPGSSQVSTPCLKCGEKRKRL